MIRIRTVMTGVAGSPWYSNHYFRTNLDGDLTSCIAAVREFWRLNLPSMHSSVIVTLDGLAVEVNPATGQITASQAYVDPPQIGTGTSELMARAAQLLVHWRTGEYINGRAVIGKTFVPGIVVGVNTAGGVPGSNALTRLSAAADALVATAGPGQAVVWSKTHGRAVDITGSTPWGQFAVLRSRRD